MKFVFDLGGVVFNWQPLALLRQTLPQRATDEASAKRLAGLIFQSFALGADWADFDRGTVEAGSLAERIAPRAGLTPAEVLAVIDAIPAHLHAKADTVALMRRLGDAGHRLYYLSNMPRPYALHLERTHRFFDAFAGGIFSCRVQLIKPEPAIFHAAALRFGAGPGELLLIDDVAHNISAARAQGWQGLQFHDAAGCETALRKSGLL